MRAGSNPYPWPGKIIVRTARLRWGELRSIHGAEMGQTMRHSMLIYAYAYAYAHANARMKKGAQALIL